MDLYRKIKKYLDENEIDLIFTPNIKSEFSEYEIKDVELAIRNVLDNEYTKIEKGKYCRNTFRDEYAIGSFLTSDATIAYWSALNIHGLTEQFPNKIYIQTTKNKQNKFVFSVEYKFVRVHNKKMIGIVKRGIGSHQYRITNMEKTIIDCFDKVDYSGGFPELIRAFARTKLSAPKMIEYTKAIGNKAVIKRIGYLSEILEKKGFKQFITYAKKQKSKNFDLLDIYGGKTGRYDSEWNLILNIDRGDLVDIANSIY